MERVPYRWWAVGVAVVIVAGAAVWGTVSAIGPEDRSGDGKPAECGVSPLRESGSDAKAVATAVSPSGEFVLGTSGADVIRWHDGKPETVKGVESAADVNSEGVIAGADESAWRFDDGRVTELDSPVDGDVDVTSVNDAGDIVGTVRDAEAESDAGDGDPVSSRGFPLLWPSGTDKPVELDVADGKRAWAEAVTEDGTVLGYQVDNGTDEQLPWRWNADGDGNRLPRLSADTDDSIAVPVDIAGDWVLSANAPNGYRWKLSEPDKGERLRLEKQSVTAIDAEGGAYGLAESDVAGRQIGDRVLPLDKLSDNPDGGNLGANRVVAASDDGTVLIGSSVDDDGIARAVTWNCG